MSRRVAVIGGGLGGLTAAARLAKDGCDVSLFEAAHHLGGKAQSLTGLGVTLDTGPTLLTMPGVVRRVFQELGAADLMPPLSTLDLQCRYTYADGCGFDAFADLARTAESVARLRPKDAKALPGFYAEAKALYQAAGEPYFEAPFTGLTAFIPRVLKRGVGAATRGLTMGTLNELARRHFTTEHLQQFVGRFATYAGASPYEASAAYAMIPWLEHSEGVHHVTGGMGALAQALAQAATRQGVTVHLGAPARWEQDGGRFVVTVRGAQHRFDTLVVNTDPMAAQGRSDEPLSLSGYVLLLSVPRRLALPHHSIRFGPDDRGEFDALFSGRVPEKPTVYVCHPAATDASMAEAGKSGLFVMVNVPPMANAQDAEAWPALAQRLRAQALEAVEALEPGATLGAEVLAERTPVDLARLGAPGGSIYGFLPHGTLGPFRRPSMTGEAKGLFFAGGGTWPGGGVPLVMLSGRHAADLALTHATGGAP